LRANGPSVYCDRCAPRRAILTRTCVSRALSLSLATLTCLFILNALRLLQCVETDYGIPDEDDEEADAARKATGGGIAQFFAGSSANRASKRVRGSYFSDRGMTQCDDF
jgi:hypothetical protein